MARYAEMKNVVAVYEASRETIHDFIMGYVTEPLQSQIHAGLTPGPTSDYLHSVIIRSLDFFAASRFLLLVQKACGLATSADEIVQLAWRLSDALLDRAPRPGKMHYCWPSEPALKALVIMRGAVRAETLEAIVFTPFILPIAEANYIQLGDLSPRPPEPSNR